MIAALIVLEVLSASGLPFSQSVSKIGRYFYSGEINFVVSNGPEILSRVRSDFADGSINDLDGIRIDYPDWWFNLRVSNTEPLLRLVVEAESKDGLEMRKSQLVEKIRRYAVT
jgi:phosphomannomutase